MKVVIIGGVAGGMACAARLRRLDESATIVVFEKGPDFSFSNCGLPYFIGGEFEDRGGLLIVKQPVLASRFRLDLRNLTEITGINRADKKVGWRNVTTGATGEESYDYLVISTGASPIVPPLPGLPHPKVLTLRNMVDMDRIVGCVQAGAKAVVVGGGFVGLEVAEALIHKKCRVEVLELLDQVLAPLDKEMAAPLQAELVRHGVTLRLQTGASGFRAVGDKLAIDTGASSPPIEDVDFVVLAIGVRPDSQLAQACGLQLTPRGYIVVDEHQRTSDPAIFAAGDVIQTHDVVASAPTVCPLAGPAARQGRVAADNIAGRDSKFRGVQATAIVRVFDYVAACTGASAKTLTRAGTPFQRIYIHPMNHVAFMPGKAQLTVKLVFRPTDGLVLGAQIIGRGQGVDSRINAFAMAIQAKQTVYDLEECELAYAPPFSSPKDPVNMAGMVAAAVLRGDMRVAHWDSVAAEDFILDVRGPSELVACPVRLGHVVNVPIEQLRARLAEVPRDRRVLITCQVGQRAYFAYRILANLGYTDIAVLSGGYLTFAQCHPHLISLPAVAAALVSCGAACAVAPAAAPASGKCC